MASYKTWEAANEAAQKVGGTVGYNKASGYYVLGEKPPPDMPGGYTPPSLQPKPPEPAPAYTPPTKVPTSTRDVPVTNWISQYQPTLAGVGQIGTQLAMPTSSPYPTPPAEPYAAQEVGGGVRFPWQTPPGVGFIAPWTEQSRFIEPSTGKYQYIQTEGAPEQIAAGQRYAQAPTEPSLPSFFDQGKPGLNYGPYTSLGEIPPELMEQYDVERGTEKVWVPATHDNEGNVLQPAHYEDMSVYYLVPKEEEALEGAEESLYNIYPVPGGQSRDYWDDEGNQWRWNPYRGSYERTGGYDPSRDYRKQEAQEPQPMTEYQESMMDYYQQQLAVEQAQHQAEMAWQQQQWQQQLQYQEQARLAALAAQPQSWLQYNALAGTTPNVQPWMMPLMSQQYPELQIGSPIPGWMGGQAEGQPMTSLPELLRPSAQYWARMGPQAQQQYLGYRQARTGATPEQAQWMQAGYAPPSGFGGLTYAR